MTRPSKNLQLSLLVFLILTVFYIIIADGMTTVTDEENLSNMAVTLYETGTPAYTLDSGKKVYLRFSFFQPLLSLPIVAVSRISAYIFTIRDKYWDYFCLTGLNIFITAGTAAVLFLLVNFFSNNRKISLLISFTYGLGTIALPYSKTFFTEPAISFFLLCSFASLVMSKANKWILFSGIMFGAVVLLKPVNIIISGVFILYMILSSKEKKSFRQIAAACGIWCAPVVISAFIYLCYNYTRYADFFQFGYPEYYTSHLKGGGVNYFLQSFTTPLWKGLSGNLFSPGKGFFYFSPPCILFFLSIKSFFRKHHYEAISVSILIFFYLYIYSTWAVWEGGTCWGPRLLVPMVPFFLLPLANKHIKKFYVIIIIIGIVVQMLAMLQDIVPVMIFSNANYGSGPDYNFLFNPWSLLLKHLSNSIPGTAVHLISPQFPAVRELKPLLFYPGYADIWWVKLISFRYHTGIVLTSVIILFCSLVYLLKKITRVSNEEKNKLL